MTGAKRAHANEAIHKALETLNDAGTMELSALYVDARMALMKRTGMAPEEFFDGMRRLLEPRKP